MKNIPLMALFHMCKGLTNQIFAVYTNCLFNEYVFKNVSALFRKTVVYSYYSQKREYLAPFFAFSKVFKTVIELTCKILPLHKFCQIIKKNIYL